MITKILFQLPFLTVIRLAILGVVLCASMPLVNAQTIKEESTEYAYQTFRDTRVVNGHSVETGMQGEMKMIISHRFGNFNSGLYELYGLDQATIRIGLDYAITNNLDVGIGRSSFQKTLDGYVKYKYKSQSSGAKVMPVTITLLQGISSNMLKVQNTEFSYPFSNRLTYFSEVIIARKFSPSFSMQIMPTYVHQNYVLGRNYTNDMVFLGVALHGQITKVLAIQAEYTPKIVGTYANGRNNCFSLGIEFQTKAHVFQFHFSNSSGMVETLFLTETAGKWSSGDVALGFNITRDFKISTRKF